MKATEELMTEHNAVLLALRLLDKVGEALEAESDEAPEHLEQLLEFLKGFVDRCHHGKEEDVLFPELERRGVQMTGGPIGVMLAEHEAGRGRIRGMTEGLARVRAGNRSAVGEIREHARAYSVLLQGHIQKENAVLFPMADRLLPEDVAARVLEQFEAIERDRVGEGKHEAYHQMLHQLKDVYQVA